MKKKYNRVLTIAGSDSGGGAGIQADIKAISANGCFAASAITAVTVQNTLGVQAVHPVPLDILEGQIDAVLSDIGADAVKIGMLHSAEVVRIVAEKIKKYAIKNVVLDPVMVSTSGHRLIEEPAVEVIKDELLPLARVVTPNVPEAAPEAVPYAFLASMKSSALISSSIKSMNSFIPSAIMVDCVSISMIFSILARLASIWSMMSSISFFFSAFVNPIVLRIFFAVSMASSTCVFMVLR